jgi:hypothetical protein
MIRTACFIILLTLTAENSPAHQDDFPELRGPYLGQKTPGRVPELFAPGIISVDADFEHSAAVFSPEGDEVFWCSRVNHYSDRPGDDFQRLYTMKMIDGLWTAPEVSPIARDLGVPVQRPVFSPDGNRLYLEFCGTPGNPDDSDIFVARRSDTGWSAPVSVSPLINTPGMERLHCVTADGSLYFARHTMSSREEILVSRFRDGTFQEPELLGESFNSSAFEIVILVAPDGEYMLVGQTADRRSSQLTISYRQDDGSWSERIRTPYFCGGFLALSPDGEYLFLLDAVMEGINWVDTSFVDELRPVRE